MCISRARAIQDELYPMRCKQCTFTLSSVIKFVASLQQTTKHQFVAFLSARVLHEVQLHTAQGHKNRAGKQAAT